MTTTLIRNADWVIAWDEIAGHHVYRRNIDIAFADGTIVFVGRDYPGTADRIIDGGDRLVLPGLIDIHAHPEHEPLYRGVREEHGFIHGSPARVAEAIAEIAALGIGGIIATFRLGPMPHEAAAGSLTLFMRRVAPEFRNPHAAH